METSSNVPETKTKLVLRPKSYLNARITQEIGIFFYVFFIVAMFIEILLVTFGYILNHLGLATRSLEVLSVTTLIWVVLFHELVRVTK